MKQNEQQVNLKDLKKRHDEFEQFEQILLVIFFSCVKLVYFNQFFFLLRIQRAGHVHKLYVELKSLCGSGFSLFAVRILANILEWTDQQHFAKLKMGFISLPSNYNAIIATTIIVWFWKSW